MVCLDPTREVADMVKTVRGQGGRAVAILDPRHPEFGFNVLDWIGTGPSTAEEDVATVVGWLTTESPDHGGNSRFFELSSEQLLTGVLGHIVFSPEYHGKRTLKALHEFMAQPEASFRKRLAQIHKASTNKFALNPQAHRLAPLRDPTRPRCASHFQRAPRGRRLHAGPSQP